MINSDRIVNASTRGVAGNRRFRKQNGPPRGESWVWFTQAMMTAPTWRRMSFTARKIVERIMIEHMSHAGTENGNLKVTYADFIAYGVRRHSITDAITEAVALGWIDVVERGRAGRAEFRFPSKYRITWLPTCDGMAPSNRWNRLTTDIDIDAALASAKRDREATREANAAHIQERKDHKARTEAARARLRLVA